MSLLPPLKAATTLAPATCPLACGLFRSSVNSGTWEVSQPMMPTRNSEAIAAEQPNTAGTSNFASFTKKVLTQRRKDLKAQRRKRNLIIRKAATKWQQPQMDTDGHRFHRGNQNDFNHGWTRMDTDFTGGNRANGEQKRRGKKMEAKRF